MEGMICLQKVVQGKNPNELIFEGYVPNYDHNRVYKFVFDGESICYTKSSITEFAKMQLAELLREEFGTPPYSYKRVKALLGNEKIYTLNFC